ncbi:MAG: XkdX family protein [Lentilactobacillus buchneri]|jgi:hypothetical protein|nr:XkdX family protein [Lentilactobacillus buchneri]MCI1950656.1 XkdX family protein [Lentilactobacillus buchneri]MCI2018267.1 XkdX family protein [Lentilactobacillus buchneri]MCI2027782.1 XkdX family protein [Lentilactobacillus buchneri]
MDLKSYPSLTMLKNFNSWGADISFAVNVSITPEQYKEITGKDYVAPAEK